MGAGKTSLMSRLLQLMDVLHAMHCDDWAQEGGRGQEEAGQLGRNEDDTKHVLCLLNFVEQVLRHPEQKKKEPETRGNKKKRKQSKVRTCPGQDRTNRHTSRHAQRAQRERVSERGSE